MKKILFAILICWSPWYTPAFGLDVAALNRMTAEERSTWVTRFLAEDLYEMDSVLAFAETNLLFELAEKWDAPDITAAAYLGQGNYLLHMRHNPQRARVIYAQGIDFANSNGLDVSAAVMLLQMGAAYCQEQQPILAYEYYIRAHDIFAEVGYEHIAYIDRYEYDIGLFFYNIEDYEAAMAHLLIAERFPQGIWEVRYKVLMLMGWCCERLGRPKEAADCLQKRLQLAQQENNAGWMGDSFVAIGESHLQDGCYPEARIYLNTGYKLTVQAAQLSSAARALILLSKVNMQEGNLYAAAEKLTEAQQYLRQTGTENWYPDLYLGWMYIHEQSNNFREAYYYRQLYDHANDSIRRVSDMRARTNIQVRLEGSLHMVQMEQERQAERTDQMLMLLTIVLLTIGGVGAYVGWKYQQRRQNTLILDRQRAEQALKEILLQQVNHHQHTDEGEMPAATAPVAAASLSFLDRRTSEQNAQEALAQISELVLLTEDDSRHFRLLFEKIHPGFFAQLRTKFPDLTQSETRLLALTKLNLNTKEMSEILNVEPNSIRRLRNRIRQKYNLPVGDNFENLLAMD